MFTQSTTWKLVFISCFCNIVWAISIQFINGYVFIFYKFNNEWYTIHHRLIKFIFWRIYDIANAEIKYLNLILGIERFIATRYPFRYKYICTKTKIFGSLAIITVFIIISRCMVYYFNEIIHVQCIHIWGSALRGYSDEFKYKTKCYDNERLPFVRSWYEMYEYWLEGATLQGFPLLALIIISVMTVIALRNQRNDPALQLSQTVRLEREVRDNQMTKLVLALILNGVITSFITIVTIVVTITDVLVSDSYECIYNVLYSCICLGFMMNPLIYFIFSKILQRKLKTLLLCMKK